MGVVDLDPASATYGHGGRARRHAGGGRRAAPFRLERVQLRAVPLRAASACRAPLPAGAGPALLAHLRYRHQARPAQAADRETIEPEEIASRTGYSRPHTLHCGPEGIYVSALGRAEGDGPGGIFLLDHESFDVLGRWEVDRGPQYLAYDFWWHLGYDTMVTSEWGTPNMIENGVDAGTPARRQIRPRASISGTYSAGGISRRSTSAPSSRWCWNCARRTIPPRPTASSAWSCRTKDLSASIWLWHRDGDDLGGAQDDRDSGRAGRPRPAAAAAEGLQGGAAAGHRHQPLARRPVPLCLLLGHRRDAAIRRVRSVQPTPHRHGAARRHRARRRRTPSPSQPLNGGPQMVEVSRDGRRVYFTNSLYRAWDEQFYPEGVRGWMAKLDVKPEGGITVDQEFLPAVRRPVPPAPGAAGGRRRLFGFVLLPMRGS